MNIDLNFIGTTWWPEHVRRIAEKCRMVLRKMETENLWSKHELPNTVQQVFDVLIQAWSHEFPGRRFAILCVQSGMPWTWPRNSIQLYTWKDLYMRHITDGLQPPSLPHYPRQTIKTRLGWYDCHVVEITKNPQVRESLQELNDFSRGKDIFLYGISDLYHI